MGKKARTKAAGPRAALLEGDWFSRAALDALGSTFRRFDSDTDGRLSIAELQAFARTCNGGDEFDEDELEQLTHFETEGGGARARPHNSLFHAAAPRWPFYPRGILAYLSRVLLCSARPPSGHGRS